MRRFLPLSLALFALASGCSATIDEAYGVPDATEWTYFQGDVERVAGAVERALARTGYRVERVGRTDAGEIALGVSLARGSAEFTEILIQPFEDPDAVFASRAQTFPRQRPLPRDLRVAVISEM